MGADLSSSGIVFVALGSITGCCLCVIGSCRLYYCHLRARQRRRDAIHL